MMRRVVGDGVAPALFGVLATFGFAPWHCYPVTLISVIGLLVLWRRAGPARGAWRGFVFGCALFGTGVSWVYVALHTYSGIAAPLAGLAVAALVGYLAIYPALAGAVAAATRRFAAPIWALLIVPAAWGLSELLRGWVGTGFPWLSLGYSTVAAPLNGVAPLLGSYGLSIVLVAAAGALWLLYAGALIARLIALALVAVLPVLVWWVPSAAHWTQPVGPRLRVAIIQGNIDQADKWQPAHRAETLARYRDMTARSRADLVVWPEVAIPAPAEQVVPYLKQLRRTAAQRNQTVLAGLLWPAANSRGYHNSVLALGQGRGRYDKRHLVPFGEYVPGPAWLTGHLSNMGAPVGRTVAGPVTQPLLHSHGVALGLSICFEDLFARDIARDLPMAGMLINVTNDAWFAGTPALAQHLDIARMRALESGRPLVRAANTGISALIGFDGHVYQHTAADESARLIAPMVPRRGLTPYMAYGDTPLWWATSAVVMLGLLGAWGLRWRAARLRRPAERRRALRARL
ncbi:apolipoprotein N-acyltransferase [Salinisphaera sp. SPP-AMP-43]|uniref:apolipoprotein N-acyltransferase n=1 Tax=Salinisphaera sp. SPP-AMP-43 TaxID=3121288 RepID=UPI003C6E04CA